MALKPRPGPPAPPSSDKLNTLPVELRNWIQDFYNWASDGEGRIANVEGNAGGGIQSFDEISGLTAETAINNADTVAIYDNSASAARQMTVANLLANVVSPVDYYTDQHTTRTAVGTSDTTFFTINVADMPQDGLLIGSIGLVIDNTAGGSRSITSGITINGTTEYGMWGSISRWSAAAPLTSNGYALEFCSLDIATLRHRMGGAFSTGAVSINIHYRASANGVFIDGATSPANAHIMVIGN